MPAPDRGDECTREDKDDTKFESRYGHRSASIISVTCVLYLSLLLIVLIVVLILMKWRKKDEAFMHQLQSKSGKAFLVLLLLTVLSYLTGNIFVVVFTTNSLAQQSMRSRASYFAMVMGVGLAYRIGRCIMTSFYLGRLYVCFHGSVFQLKRWVLITLQIFIILPAIIGTIATLPRWLDELGEYKSEFTVCHMIAFVMDTIVNVIILYLFVRKLWTITLSQSSEVRISQSVVERDMDAAESPSGSELKKRIDSAASLNENQMPLMQTIIKNTNLALCTLVTSLVPVAYGAATEGQDDGCNNGPPGDPVMLCMLLVVDGAMNSLCMYFVFAFAKKEYYRCCKCCDKCMEKLCVNLTQKSIRRKMMKDVQKVQSDIVQSRTKQSVQIGSISVDD